MISDDEIIRDFGQKLKRERIKKKMTQTQLGEIVGAISPEFLIMKMGEDGSVLLRHIVLLRL